MAKSKAHPGFKAASKSIQAKEGVSAKSAGAILASSSRKAVANGSKNPKLKRVK
jgi:hypothetical protein